MRKILLMLSVAFILILLPLVSAETKFNVEVKGVSAEQAPISVSVGETVPVKAYIRTADDVEDCILTATLSYRDSESKANSNVFNAYKNATYDKTLYLSIPTNEELKEITKYTVVVQLEDEDENVISSNNTQYKKTFEVIVQRKNNNLEIKDVSLPEVFDAGDEKLVAVTIENIGINAQDDVYVELSIPRLGVVSEEYAGLIPSPLYREGDENEVTVNVPVKLPSVVETGAYVMDIRVFNENVEATQTKSVEISGVSREIVMTDIWTKEIIKDIEQGTKGVYQIVLTNLGTAKQTYVVKAEGTKDWATVQIEPETVIIGKDSSQTVEVYVSPDVNVLGEKQFRVTIKNENGEFIRDIALVADIKEPGIEAIRKMDPFMTSLIGFAIVLFVVLLLFTGFKIKSEYNRRFKEAQHVIEAEVLGQEEARIKAKEEASELVSKILNKVFEADEKHTEVAKERAASRAQEVVENLREDEIEEVFDNAVNKLSNEKTADMDFDEKKETKKEIRSHVQDVLHKMTHRLNEKEVDDVVEDVAEKLRDDEIEKSGVEGTIQSLSKLRDKLGDEIQRLEVEEEEEVILPGRKRKKKSRKAKTVKRAKKSKAGKAKRTKGKKAKKARKKAKKSGKKKIKKKAKTVKSRSKALRKKTGKAGKSKAKRAKKPIKKAKKRGKKKLKQRIIKRVEKKEEPKPLEKIMTTTKTIEKY